MPYSRTETSEIVTALSNRHIGWEEASIGILQICVTALALGEDAVDLQGNFRLSEQDRLLVKNFTRPTTEMLEQAKKGFFLVKKDTTTPSNGKNIAAANAAYNSEHLSASMHELTPAQKKRGYVLTSEAKTFTPEELEQVNERLFAYFLLRTTLAKLQPSADNGTFFWNTSLDEENVYFTLNRLQRNTQALANETPPIKNFFWEVQCMIHFYDVLVAGMHHLAESSKKTNVAEFMAGLA